MKPFRHTDTLLAALLALAAFVVYLLTMSSHVGEEDAGEIAAALWSTGILHPTGYPLYTLLGTAFLRLPLGETTVIWRLNLMGAIYTALATFLFYRAFLELLAPREPFHRPERTATVPASRLRAAAAAATVIFAFSAVYWYEAVWLEVYALHLVFLALVTRLYLSALRNPGEGRRWLLFAYALGLSFAHHMMTVLLAPAFLTLFFQVHGFGRRAGERVLRAVPSFLLGLSAYLYLPIRSAANPLMNWGEPSTPVALWKHMTAAQYGGQMFSSLEVTQRKLTQFVLDLPGDFGYAPLALSLLGLWELRRAPRLLVFSVLIFATGLFYAVNYAFDDPNFHLNPHFMVAVWAGYGALALLRNARRKWAAPAGLAVAAAALSPLAFNYPKLDKSADSVIEDYARNVLASLDSGAVLFSNEYERLGGPAFYLQNVEGYRRDAAVIDIILLSNPWYFGHLEQTVPWLVGLAEPEIRDFRAAMDDFLAAPRDSARLRASLAVMFGAMVERSRAEGRPVYVTAGINPAMIEQYQHAPTGLVFRLLDPEDTTRVPLREPAYRPLSRHNRVTPKVRADYAQSYAYQGAYAAQWGDSAEAVRLLGKALELLPDFPDAEAYLRELTAPSR